MCWLCRFLRQCFLDVMGFCQGNDWNEPPQEPEDNRPAFPVIEKNIKSRDPDDAGP
jgi:hypothetical protein